MIKDFSTAVSTAIVIIYIYTYTDFRVVYKILYKSILKHIYIYCIVYSLQCRCGSLIPGRYGNLKMTHESQVYRVNIWSSQPAAACQPGKAGARCLQLCSKGCPVQLSVSFLAMRSTWTVCLGFICFAWILGWTTDNGQAGAQVNAVQACEVFAAHSPNFASIEFEAQHVVWPNLYNTVYLTGDVNWTHGAYRGTCARSWHLLELESAWQH